MVSKFPIANEPSDMSISNITPEDKHEFGKLTLIQRHERIKLPILAYDIYYVNPNYTTIDSNWSSTWDLIKQSRLIESLIINIPVPPIILYEVSYGKKYKIVDGRERLKAIADFYNRRLVLNGLELNLGLEGQTCNTLPVIIKSALDLRSLDLTTIFPKKDISPDKAARLMEIVAARLEKG
jgi:hypothetical protein